MRYLILMCIVACAMAEDKSPKPIKESVKLEISQAMNDLLISQAEWEKFGLPIYQRMQAAEKRYKDLVVTARKDSAAPANCDPDRKQNWACKDVKPQDIPKQESQ